MIDGVDASALSCAQTARENEVIPHHLHYPVFFCVAKNAHLLCEFAFSDINALAREAFFGNYRKLYGKRLFKVRSELLCRCFFNNVGVFRKNYRILALTFFCNKFFHVDSSFCRIYLFPMKGEGPVRWAMPYPTGLKEKKVD